MLSRFEKFLKLFILTHRRAIHTSYRCKRQKFLDVVENESKRNENIIMQRLPVNSLNLEFLEELTTVIKRLEEKNYKGMIISSNIPNIFSAGLDIKEMYKPEEARVEKIFVLQNMWKTLYTTPLITIAAVNGYAPAGGCIIALSCDYCLMANTKATIGLNETLLGLQAPKWLCNLYVNKIGFDKAEHALKLGKLLTPKEALKLNIVNEVVENPEELLEKAEKEMNMWLKIPEAAFKLTKVSLRTSQVKELESYEKQEIEDRLSFYFQENTQKILGEYYENLKEKKKNK